jgi:hypothetical protein
MVRSRFDPESYLPLTPAMFHVLVALADGEKHGYAIIKEVHRRTDGKVRLGAGTLYALIRRFVEDGLIVESDARPDPALDDDRRRADRPRRSRARDAPHRVAIVRNQRHGRRHVRHDRSRAARGRPVGLLPARSPRDPPRSQHSAPGGIAARPTIEPCAEPSSS